MGVRVRKAQSTCNVAIVQFVFHTKYRNQNERYGERYAILNSWRGREGKIGSEYGCHCCIPLTVVSTTRSVAWTAMMVEEHLEQETQAQYSQACWGCREVCIQVFQLDVRGWVRL